LGKKWVFLDIVNSFLVIFIFGYRKIFRYTEVFLDIVNSFLVKNASLARIFFAILGFDQGFDQRLRGQKPSIYAGLRFLDIVNWSKTHFFSIF
jgi:hypothetical protein